MAYCTQDDLLAAYGEEELLKAQPLGDPAVEPPVIDGAAVAAAIQAAADEIDSYVLQRYRLPLAGAAAARLKRRCVDIAMYYLAPSPAAANSTRRLRYEDAVQWLKGVAAGYQVLEPRPAAAIQSDARRHVSIPGNPSSRRQSSGSPCGPPGRRGRFT